jgi:hypothetical protein
MKQIAKSNFQQHAISYSIFMYAPVVMEKYVVSLIMEGRNSSTMKVGVLWEKRLYHPEDKNNEHGHASS